MRNFKQKNLRRLIELLRNMSESGVLRSGQLERILGVIQKLQHGVATNNRKVVMKTINQIAAEFVLAVEK